MSIDGPLEYEVDEKVQLALKEYRDTLDRIHDLYRGLCRNMGNVVELAIRLRTSKNVSRRMRRTC